MNELIKDNEIKMNHVELCELINILRKEEGSRKELRTCDFLSKIKKEVETMKTLGLEGERNFSSTSYKDKQGKERPTFIMNRDGILQIASSESVYVRAKIIEYINALENKLKEQQLELNKKQQLQLAILNGDDMTKITALKEYETYLTQPLLDKIENDKPLVNFAETISQTADSISIGDFAKLVKDENIKMGRNKLFEWLRDNKYLMKGNIPYQKYIDNNYFELIEYSYKTPYGEKLTTKTLITGLGQIKIIEKLRRELNGAKELQEEMKRECNCGEDVPDYEDK